MAENSHPTPIPHSFLSQCMLESLYILAQILKEDNQIKCWPVNNRLDFPSGSVVKNPPAMQEPQETQVGSLGWKDPLEEGMATHSSILALQNPMDRGAWQATAHGVTKSQTEAI